MCCIEHVRAQDGGAGLQGAVPPSWRMARPLPASGGTPPRCDPCCTPAQPDICIEPQSTQKCVQQQIRPAGSGGAPPHHTATARHAPHGLYASGSCADSMGSAAPPPSTAISAPVT